MTIHRKSWEVANIFLSLRLHFKKKTHNYFETPYILKAAHFADHKDRIIYDKISKHEDPFNLILSNLLVKPDIWAGDVVSEEGEQIYQRRKGRLTNLRYTFSEDLKRLRPNFDDNIKIQNGTFPHLILEHIKDKICLETVVIISDICESFPYWDKRLSLDPLWHDIALKISKYPPFLPYDKEVFKAILIKHFEEMIRG